MNLFRKFSEIQENSGNFCKNKELERRRRSEGNLNITTEGKIETKYKTLHQDNISKFSKGKMQSESREYSKEKIPPEGRENFSKCKFRKSHLN